MLLVAGRLEAAGLDQRKIPRSLLPGTALAGARLARGPAPDAPLPDPPPDAAGRVERLRTASEIGVPHDGTAHDALREGLHLLGAAGIDVRHETAVLLPALYVALVAGEFEELAGERAVAWALGLAEDCALAPVTDVLLTAPQRGLDPDTTLGRLFGIPAFADPVAAGDRQWHSWPGTGLTSVAFGLGYPQVITRDGKVIRVDADQAAARAAQCRRSEEKFGRPPGLMIRCSSTRRRRAAAGVPAGPGDRDCRHARSRRDLPGVDLRLPAHRRPAARLGRELRQSA